MQMDKPSIALAHFMDSMVVEEKFPGEPYPLVMVHKDCNTAICDVEDGDNLRVLFNTALGHDCPDTKKGGK